MRRTLAGKLAVTAAKRARREEKASDAPPAPIVNRLQSLPGAILELIGAFCRYDGVHTTVLFYDALVLIDERRFTTLLENELFRVGMPTVVSRRGQHGLNASLGIEFEEIEREERKKRREEVEAMRTRRLEFIAAGDAENAARLEKAIADYKGLDKWVLQEAISARMRGKYLQPAQRRALIGKLREAIPWVCRFCGKYAGGASSDRDRAPRLITSLLVHDTPRSVGYSGNRAGLIPHNLHYSCAIERMQRLATVTQEGERVPFFAEVTRAEARRLLPALGANDVYLAVKPCIAHYYQKDDDRMLMSAKLLAEKRKEYDARLKAEAEHERCEREFLYELAPLVQAKRDAFMGDVLADVFASARTYLFDTCVAMLRTASRTLTGLNLHEAFAPDGEKPDRDAHLAFVCDALLEQLNVLVRGALAMQSDYMLFGEHHFGLMFTQLDARVRDKRYDDMAKYYAEKRQAAAAAAAAADVNMIE